MTLTASITAAESEVRQNLSNNLIALDLAQPDIRPWITDTNLHVEWLFARDRTLSGLDETGHWIGGCSLPRRAAEAMLKRLEIKGAVAGFLAPAHAAQIAFALDKIRPEQAVVVIVPEIQDLATILHCHDFSQDIKAHRLWFAAGPAWEVGLQRIFENRPGLATPTQFIRMPDADASYLEELIAAAQKVFSDVGASRSTLLQELRQSPPSTKPGKPKMCIVAPSRFRLWNDIGQTLVRLFDEQSEIEAAPFDADDPANSSPLALLQAARQCSSILTANTTRTDLPGLIPETVSWITWTTTARIPSCALAGVDDHLIVVDPTLREAAIQSGWPESRVHVGTWPPTRPIQSRTCQRELAVIADTSSLETPEDLIDYSSHMVLWESIRNELGKDPVVLNDLNKFLNERMRRLGVGDDAFARNRFIEKLLIPAYQQGWVRLLIRAQLPLKLYGRGWNDLDEFKSFVCGPIQSRSELQDAMRSAAALVHVWPTPLSHPVDSVGIPIIRASGQRSTGAFLRDAQSALRGTLPEAPINVPPLSAELIHRIILRSSV